MPEELAHDATVPDGPGASAEEPVLVLASASPRRQHLLAEYGYRALIQPTQVEESDASWLSVPELVLLNARRKSAALWEKCPGGLILGADTLVCLDGKAFGKPVDLAEAFDMLSRLSGRTQQVYSGVCLALPGRSVFASFVEETQVTFLSLDPAQISHYLTLINPLDKAGGYAAQEHGDKIIASVSGSWTNVLGLPMERLARTLKETFDILPEA